MMLHYLQISLLENRQCIKQELKKIKKLMEPLFLIQLQIYTLQI